MIPTSTCPRARKRHTQRAGKRSIAPLCPSVFTSGTQASTRPLFAVRPLHAHLRGLRARKASTPGQARETGSNTQTWKHSTKSYFATHLGLVSRKPSGWHFVTPPCGPWLPRCDTPTAEQPPPERPLQTLKTRLHLLCVREQAGCQRHRLHLARSAFSCRLPDLVCQRTRQPRQLHNVGVRVQS